jgi:hypothetical protein
VGLLLWAPFASTMREEHPLLVALEEDRRTLMPRTATAESGVESNRTQVRSSRIAALTIDEGLTDLRLRNPHSSQHMVALP